MMSICDSTGSASSASERPSRSRSIARRYSSALSDPHVAAAVREEQRGELAREVALALETVGDGDLHDDIGAVGGDGFGYVAAAAPLERSADADPPFALELRDRLRQIEEPLLARAPDRVRLAPHCLRHVDRGRAHSFILVPVRGTWLGPAARWAGRSPTASSTLEHRTRDRRTRTRTTALDRVRVAVGPRAREVAADLVDDRVVDLAEQRLPLARACGRTGRPATRRRTSAPRPMRSPEHVREPSTVSTGTSWSWASRAITSRRCGRGSARPPVVPAAASAAS